MGLEVELRIVNKAGVVDKVEIKECRCIYNSELRKGVFTNNVHTLSEEVVEANVERTLSFRKNYLARDLVEIITRTEGEQCRNVIIDSLEVMRVVGELSDALELNNSVYNSSLLDRGETEEFVREVTAFLNNFDSENNILVHSFV